MKILKKLLCLSAILWGLTTTAYAQNPEDNKVQIRLMAERGEIYANDEIWIGIEQSIAPHWHTYWQNPGDSGTPTRIKWNLPEGFEISDIHWPAPQKIPYEPLLNYGYEKNVILLQKLKAPASIPEKTLNLTADIELLVCKETCIPEYGTYTLTLNDANSMAEDNTAYFEQAISKLPIKSDTKVTHAEQDGDFILTITNAKNINIDNVQYFPLDWGIIENTAEPEITIKEDIITIKQQRGERDLNEVEKFDGVITYETSNGETQSFAFTSKEQSNAHNPQNKTGVIQALLLALIGGIILNLMPCVFPVLSIKALSLVKTADKHPNLAKLHGLSYTAGVVSSFLAVAGLLLILKAAGAQIGWGFQLQSPTVVAFLAYLLFLIGLSLSGFFEIGGNITNIGNKLTQGQGLASSFFTGVLATIVAAPCTAPFMAAAIGFALTQSAFVNLLVFATLGFGLALPYLLLSFIPALRSALPKPGAWMNTFKQLLSFPMFLSAIWLVWVLSQQAGPSGVLEILIGMALLTFGIWLFKHKPKKETGKTIVKTLAIICIIAALFLGIKETQMPNAQEIAVEEEQFGEVYSPEKLETLLNGADPIFVEMTAAWCITCKVNHAIAINTNETKELFKTKNVRYLIGDWTNQDPIITKFLNDYGRNGVPIYVYYAPRDKNGERPEPKILPQILTPGIINDIITKEIQ